MLRGFTGSPRPTSAARSSPKEVFVHWFLMAIGVALFAPASMDARFAELSDRVGALEHGRPGE